MLEMDVRFMAFISGRRRFLLCIFYVGNWFADISRRRADLDRIEALGRSHNIIMLQMHF